MIIIIDLKILFIHKSKTAIISQHLSHQQISVRDTSLSHSGRRNLKCQPRVTSDSRPGAAAAAAAADSNYSLCQFQWRNLQRKQPLQNPPNPKLRQSLRVKQMVTVLRSPRLRQPVRRPKEIMEPNRNRPSKLDRNVERWR